MILAGPARRPRAAWLLLSALVATSTILAVRPAAADRTDALDWRRAPNALGLELSAAAGRGTATFVWHLAPDAGAVVCRLDADGDGEIDHEVLDCAAHKSWVHRFDASGIYRATLLATGEGGRTGIARATVAVAVD